MTWSNRHSGFEVQGCAQAKDASSSPEFECTSHEVLCAGRVATTLPLSLCWSRPSRRCAKPTSKSLLYTAGFPKWSAESHQKWIPTTFPTTLTPSSSVMLWRGIMGFTKFGDKRVNDLALLSGYVVSYMLAPRKSMQADLHAARSPYVLIICSLPVVFVCNALFLFLLLYFHMYKPQTNRVNVCAQLISLRNEHFFSWHLRCAVFSYVQTPGILWKHLCAAHSIEKSHAMTTPSICCVFICTNPNQTSILGSGGELWCEPELAQTISTTAKPEYTVAVKYQVT